MTIKFEDPSKTFGCETKRRRLDVERCDLMEVELNRLKLRENLLIYDNNRLNAELDASKRQSEVSISHFLMNFVIFN